MLTSKIILIVINTLLVVLLAMFLFLLISKKARYNQKAFSSLKRIILFSLFGFISLMGSFFILGLIKGFVIDVTLVAGPALEPAYPNGSIVLFSRSAREVHRNDIILFQNPNRFSSGQQRLFINRVVGIPGDEIQQADGVLVINGEVIIGEALQNPGAIQMTLSHNEYFVLGDNYSRSFDSRHWGAVSAQNILGKVIFPRRSQV